MYGSSLYLYINYKRWHRHIIFAELLLIVDCAQQRHYTMIEGYCRPSKTRARSQSPADLSSLATRQR